MPEHFHIAGRSYDQDAIRAECVTLTKDPHTADYQQDIWLFIQQWFNDNTHISVRTSGSTGAPSERRIPKEWMRASARVTALALGLHPEDRALLCISAKHIGGMMMIVRSFEIGMRLEIEAPSRSPKTTQQVDFTAKVPMQVQTLLEANDDLRPFGKIIVGGAPLDPRTERKLLRIETPIYATFGMTETVSHIALRRLSGEMASPLFETVEGVAVSCGDDGRLKMTIAHMDQLELVSNDLVDIIDSQHFIWKGRVDNIINSGGIKLSPEVIESQLSEQIDLAFFIHKQEDAMYGEMVVLCIEGSPTDTLKIKQAIDAIPKSKQRPKEVYLFDRFSRTENGKLLRTQTFIQEKRRLF